MADALVVAHAEHDVVHVGAHRLAHRGDGVDEADLGGKERVAGVLDELGRRWIGHDQRRRDADVERRDPNGGGLVLSTDDDPVGMQEVVHRGALAQELRVRHDIDVAATERLLDDASRPTGTVDLLTTIALGLEVRSDLLGRRLDVREIGRPVGALRRLHAEEDELALAGGLRRADDERQATAVHALAHQVLEPGLEDRNLAAVELVDALDVDVGARDVVTEMYEASRPSSVPRSHNRRP